LFVRDIRSVRGMPQDRQRYRTYSFAAVPMFAGGETVGVLTATDKRDGSAFNRLDIAKMRTLSVAAAVTLVAARSHAEVARLAYATTIDSLTGLLNRPYLDARLHQEVERARRGATLLTVLMADIDDFKAINDTYGHQIGDAALQVIGSIIRSAVRVFDVSARYGGDEFVILMPNGDYSSALACAERIRRRVAEYRAEKHDGPNLPALTISIGIAVVQAGDTAAALLRRADESLYQAKADGKNVVRAHPSVLTGQQAPGLPDAARRRRDVTPD
jgi:diguanylate cyclase (GGDEF)-like protein